VAAVDRVACAKTGPLTLNPLRHPGRWWVIAWVLIHLSAAAVEPRGDPAEAPPATAARLTEGLPELALHLAQDLRAPEPSGDGLALRSGAVLARFDTRGVHAHGWRFQLRGPRTRPQRDGERITYARPDGVTEWYRATERGIEQGFTVPRLPRGDLELAGQIAGPPGVPIEGGYAFGSLHYTELHAFDAERRPLPASLHLEGDRLAIRISAAALKGARAPLSIDPLLSTPALFLDPTNLAGTTFGYPVARAGDVNGDGFADLIVGSPGYGPTFAGEGRAYVFHGTAGGLNTTAAWALDPTDQAGARFGDMVAPAGDVNGDGFADVMVGACYWDGAQADEGRVYLFLGSSSGLSTTPQTFDPTNQLQARFGFSAAAADVNGDGYSDLFIAADEYDALGSNVGQVYGYRGSATGIVPTVFWTSVGPNQADARFGWPVECAGDVNGDGFADLLISAAEYNQSGTSNSGRSYLYLGNSTGLNISAVWEVTPELQVDASLHGQGGAAGAGDVNGDGFDDILVGVPGFDSGSGTSEGRVHLYLGGPGGPSTTSTWSVDPADETEARFGARARGAGDVNGDGYADVIIGAPGASGGEGRTYHYLGRASPVGLLAAPSWPVDAANQVGANFGLWANAAGDVNGDGLADAVVSASDYDGTSVNEGRAWLFLGDHNLGFTGSSINPVSLAGNSDRGAEAIAMAGDVNGDGFADVIVGAPKYSNQGVEEGRILLYLGTATGLSTTALLTREPANSTAAHFGAAVAGAGDVNGDGFADVIVGAPGLAIGDPEEGRAYLYTGNASGLSGTAAWFTDQTSILTHYGFAVAGGGDVNADGYADVLVGAPDYDNQNSDEGIAFLFLGGPAGLPASPSWSAEPGGLTSQFGAAIAHAGDVNRDGFGDVLIGAPGYGGSPGEGGAFLYLGNATGLNATFAWSAEPTNTNNARYGAAVAGIGDVNRDGYADLAVGAPAATGTAGTEGRTYTYLGAASGVPTASTVLEPSNTSSALYGSAIAGVGDLDGDGYDDALVGAPGWSGANREGRAYLHLGAAAGLVSTAALFFSPTSTAFAGYGTSVAAGDVTRDGVAELYFGAPGMNLDEGRFYQSLSGDLGQLAGLDRRLRQLRGDGTTPVALGSRTGGPVQLSARPTGELPAGGRLRMEFEIKAVGTAFNGAGLITSPVVWGGATATITATLAAGAYHWRTRVLYPAMAGHGRWVSFGGNAEGAADFHSTAAGLPDGSPCGMGGQCLSGFCADSVCCNAACNGGACDACAVAAGAAVDGTCALLSSSVTCRAAASVCDVAETCTGSTPACPADAFAGATTECRASAGACDPAEACTGSSAACPVDALASGTTECRPAVGACDLAELCTGAAVACPADGFALATAECRAAAGSCDVAERCTGTSGACPGNGFRPEGASCADATYCNGIDVCQTGVCVSSGVTCVDPRGEEQFVCVEATQSCQPVPTAPAIIRDALPGAAVGWPYPYNAVGRVRSSGSRPLTFALCDTPPPGMRLQSRTGELTWTPLIDDLVPVCVSVTNALGSDVYRFNVAVLPGPAGPAPVASFTVSPPSGPAPHTALLDGTASTASPLLAHRWESGHGEPPLQGPVVAYSYPLPGGYQPRLTVLDGFGRTASTQRRVEVVDAQGRRPPSARIQASALAGVDSLEVSFTCECAPGDSPISVHLWDLGPDAQRLGPEVVHRFGPGRHRVRLTVVDSSGLIATDSVELTVTRGSQQPPRCSLTATPSAGPVPLDVTYLVSYSDGDGEVRSSVVRFDDGFTSSELRVDRRHLAPGHLTARLEVVDDADLKCFDSLRVSALSADRALAPELFPLPESEATCRVAWSATPAVRGDRPLRWSLVSGPAGLTVDEETGALSWTPAVRDRGEATARVRVENAAGADETDLALRVACSPRYAIGCGCGAGSGSPLLGALLLLAMSARRRRP
jgi:hypothetical protein